MPPPEAAGRLLGVRHDRHGHPSSLSAASAAAVARTAACTPRAPVASRTLSPEALAVADKPTAAPISPIVLAGIVRMVEFALVVLVGIALYASICRRCHRADLALSRRRLRHRCAVDARLPDRRHLPGAGVPRPREAVHAARVGLVGGLPDRHRRLVLRQGRRDVFARLARHLLRRRTCRADRLARLCSSLVRKWTREGRLTRRTVIVGGGEPGAARDRGIAPPEGYRHRDHRPVRRPRRRSRAPTAPASASSAPSTIWSSSAAAPASIW